MGVVWFTGSKYTGPFGVVQWLSLSNRSALNGGALSIAAFLWNLPTRVNFPDLSIPIQPVDSGWSLYGNERVVAWNGGHSDVP
jgi:hypothetical protein